MVEFLHSLRNRSDSNTDSVQSKRSLERKPTILSKAKDTTKSIIDVLDKRPDRHDSPSVSRSSSLNSLEKGSLLRRSLLIKKDQKSLPSSPIRPDSPAATESVERPGSFSTSSDFRLASDKKNEQFHVFFKSVPETDNLIEDYSCALLRDILLQGHLYVSEHHVCFKFKILGWATNLVIHMSEITHIEKRNTAKIIPNGITIYTAEHKHTFASLLSRDQAYDQIVKVWELNKKSLLTTDSEDSIDSAVDLDHSKRYSEDVCLNAPLIRPRAASDPYAPYLYTNRCSCDILSYNALDDSFDSTVERMNKLLFHSHFIKEFLEKYEHFQDVQMGKWKHRSREYNGKTYNSGNTLVNTLIQETEVHKKLPYYVCVSTKISTPYLGTAYCIHSKTCITRINREKVHLLVTFDVVFTKSGVMSDTIEKTAVEILLSRYQRLKSVLSHPESVKALVMEKEMMTKSSRRPSVRILYMISIGLVLVVAAHVVLACRLNRIMGYLDDVKSHQVVRLPDQKDAAWIEENMGNVNTKLVQLKDRMRYYDERLLSMKQSLTN